VYKYQSEHVLPAATPKPRRRKRVVRGLLVVMIAVSAAGCATITRGTTQVVAVNTPGAPGATCTLTSASIGAQTLVTPATVSLQKGRDNIAVHCTKECYQDGAGVIASSMEGMTAGNIVLGGVIGLGVDAASGAMNSYAPEIQVVMTPIAGLSAVVGRAATRSAAIAICFPRYYPAPSGKQRARSGRIR
jgi:hypothetical protein